MSDSFSTMNSMIPKGSLPAIVLVMMFLLGCDRKPAPAEMPPLDPKAIASGAMKAYDTGGDGAISGDELKAAACLTDHPDLPVKLIDKNSDGSVSEDEIRSRAQQWIDSNNAIFTFPCTVNMDGKPLEGATVKYVPEPFMGGAVEAATGVTDATGSAVMGIDQAALPPELKGITGVRSGFYKVEITHPSVKIPAKYNAQTTLGLEAAYDSTATLTVVHELKSR